MTKHGLFLLLILAFSVTANVTNRLGNYAIRTNFNLFVLFFVVCEGSDLGSNFGSECTRWDKIDGEWECTANALVTSSRRQGNYAIRANYFNFSIYKMLVFIIDTGFYTFKNKL